MTLQEFCSFWSHKQGVLHIVDKDNYDKIDDALEECITDPMRIFGYVGCSPYFSIWVSDIVYAPKGFLADEWADATIYSFFVVDGGIIALVEYDDIRRLREERKNGKKQ